MKPRSLWIRLVVAVGFVVALTLAGAAAFLTGPFEKVFEDEDQTSFDGEKVLLEGRMTQQLASLADALDKVEEHSKGTTGNEAHWTWASEKLPKGVDHFKILAADGEILSSAHWAASIGARDADPEGYREGLEARVHPEPLAGGPVLSLQSWRSGRWMAEDVTFVVGWQMDPGSLEELRAAREIDLLALCRETEALSTASNAPALEQLQPCEADLVSDSIDTREIELADNETRLVLVRNSKNDELRTEAMNSLLLLAVISAVVAMLTALLLARRIAAPVEALAETAGQLAQGDLNARVESSGSKVREVEGLVEAFNQMAEALQRSQAQEIQRGVSEGYEDIARGLAHEMKNPLTPIQTAMHNLQKAHSLGRDDFDVILDESSRSVIEEVTRLKDMVDNFARYAQRPDPSPELIDIPELMDNAVNLYRSAEDTLTVVRSYDPDMPKISADRNQLQTVVKNIVKNAKDAMGTGVLYLSARRLQSSPGHEGVELSIRDGGPGIAPEVLGKIFTPFVTTKGSKNRGLGLAMSDQIVQAHGGTIEARNHPEGGAEFVIWLPLAPPQVPPRSAPEPR
ncbi:MAG: HAMP domain-containing sensor histidine kinase [Myxococcota bacterium]|nr:HAMP domain-containing sensor histidine kinase [Myxococcota bacterium]